MKVPHFLKIGYKKYTTVGLKKEDAHRIGIHGIHGQIEFDEQKILYNKENNNLELFNTIFHECLHGIFDHYDIPVKNEAHEEKLVKLLSNAITCFLVDNPEFIEFLQKTLEEKD